MTNLLRASSFVTLAATVLTFGSPAGAFADGRGDWKDYAWKSIKIADCAAQGSTLACSLYHQKWDWKRNQWVDIAISLNLVGGDLNPSQRLTDKDKMDDDDFCVTALAVDADGNNLIAHHQNWHMRHGKVEEKSFSYNSSALDTVAVIHIGSKQCRQGPTQDDAIYTRLLAGLQR